MSVDCFTSDVGVHPLTGESVFNWHLSNDNIQLVICSYGLRLQSLMYKDQYATPLNMVLGLANFDAYQHDNSYLGAVVGRYANRIRNGAFSLGDLSVNLDLNHGQHHLHGGSEGFSHAVWQGETIADGITFRLLSAAGEQGYPGALNVTVTVSLIGASLGYHYQATSDADTIINLTNHSYFNLNGSSGWEQGGVTIRDHLLRVRASNYLPIDSETLPTGQIGPVEGTPFDFRQATVVGAGLVHDNEQLRRGQGFDHCLVLDAVDESSDSAPAASLYSKQSGILLEVITTEPGLQLYTGNYLLAPQAGLCLETQHFPDSPNLPQFPSTVLTTGEVFDSTTIYRFSCDQRLPAST